MTLPCFLGAGLATHLGTGLEENLTGLREPPGPPLRVERRIDDRIETIPCKPLAQVPGELPDRRMRRVIETVVEEALLEAGLGAADVRRMALFIGSSSFDIGVSESAHRQELADGLESLPLQSSSIANLAEAVRERFGLRGEDFTFNTACTSSANGLAYAARLVKAGAVEHALVLGVELLNDLTALGFLGLGLLTRSTMKPFDRACDGLVLGEACSALVVGPGDAGRFHWRGGANRCDTTSMVAANPDGSSVDSVIREALGDARICPDAIAAVKVHATANRTNDEAEAAGLKRIFSTVPPVCALKPFIGHTLGACGLTELILFYRALERGFLIATPGAGNDPVTPGVVVNQVERAMTRGYFVLNAFGFGGNNTSIVIGRS
jgi:3-oxoacyl-[acyl-carrier-protein] synthase-1